MPGETRGRPPRASIKTGKPKSCNHWRPGTEYTFKLSQKPGDLPQSWKKRIPSRPTHFLPMIKGNTGGTGDSSGKHRMDLYNIRMHQSSGTWQCRRRKTSWQRRNRSFNLYRSYWGCADTRSSRPPNGRHRGPKMWQRNPRFKWREVFSPTGVGVRLSYVMLITNFAPIVLCSQELLQKSAPHRKDL